MLHVLVGVFHLLLSIHNQCDNLFIIQLYVCVCVLKYLLKTKYKNIGTCRENREIKIEQK